MGTTSSATTARALTGADNVQITSHVKMQMLAKGFTGRQIISALTAPEKITDVRRYPGQLRYCGAGVAVVVRPERVGRSTRYVVITCYADGIITALRADQMSDPAALHSRRLAWA